MGFIATFCDIYPDATVTTCYKCYKCYKRYKCYKLAQTSSETARFYRKEMNMPQFQNTISYADLVIFVLLVIAFVAIFLVRRQARQSKATFFKELYLSRSHQVHGEVGVHCRERKKIVISANTTAPIRARLRHPSTRPIRARRRPLCSIAVFLA